MRSFASRRASRLAPLVSLALASTATLGLLACSGDDTNVPLPTTDGGADATALDGAASDGATEASSATDAGSHDASEATDAANDGPVDSGPAAQYLTLSYTFDSYAKSAYSAFNLSTNAVEGTPLTYVQFGTNVTTTSSPWVLEQYSDVVLKMDPAQPWKALSSWNVAEPAPEDGGAAYSDAFAVAEVGTKAYVALYTRDYIAVLDTSTNVDGGTPLHAISLSQFVSDADIDHGLEAIALAYDTKQNLVWAVLGNTNQGADPSSGAYTVCTPGFHPIVIAIDPTSDSIVASKTYALSGYDIYPGSAVAFDQAGDRLLVASQGCSDIGDAGDGGVTVGPTVDSYVESLDLTTGVSTVLLNPAPAGAGQIVYIDSTHAFISSYNGVNAWDTTSTTLGALVANAPAEIAWDGNGHLVGPQVNSLADGGTSFTVISVDPNDGGVTTLATNPFTPTPDAYGLEGPATWPQP